MPPFTSAAVRRKALWFTSAAAGGVVLADWFRFQRDGTDGSLVWRHVLAPQWSSHDSRHYRSRGVYAAFFGEPPSAVAHAEEREWGPWKHCPFRHRCGGDDGLPQDMRTRFMRYATSDPVTGEWVLTLHDFVRCMLLMPPSSEKRDTFRGPPFMRARYEADQKAKAKAREAAAPTAPTDVLPPHVERRLRGIFDAVDLDRSGTVDYAEFVVLFTMLSTRRRTFKMAFELLDDDDNRAVNERELTRLLNTLMVDPSVQLVYDGAAEPLGTDMTRSASSRRIRRVSRDDDFSHRIPSSLVMNFVRRPIPRHEEPPPGSTHHTGEKKALIKQLDAQLEKDRLSGLVSYDTFWYRMDHLRWELRAVEFGTFDTNNTGRITLRDFRSVLSYSARHRAQHLLAVNGATESAEHGAAPAAARASDAAPRRGFWNFGKRYDSKEEYERQCGEQRAVTSRLRKDALDEAIGPISEDEPIISWQFYQTVFDIIRESDRTLPALKVALRALPPTLTEDLVAGAIPDGETVQRSEEVKGLVVQKAEASSDATKKAVRESQAKLVRPTALTWRQFGRVLGAVDGIPKLTDQDQRLFFALFDADRSGTITPDEFAQLCELKRSFFAVSLPRFSEPRRNPVQQFVFCMQQLE